MFKTVRKGDASLQYTILPQTEQFFNGPLPQPPDTRPSTLQKLIIPSLFISICFCSILAIFALFIMTQHEPGLLNSTKIKQNKYEDEIKLNNPEQTTTTESFEIREAEIFSTNTTIEINSTIQTIDTSIMSESMKLSADTDENISKMMNTITEYTSPENEIMLRETEINSPPSENLEQSLAHDLPSTTIDSSPFPTSSDQYSTIPNDLTMNTMNSTNIFKRAKMPRVTLKLRENDTIPQMYMKAGIASYKKGNITTSVLAHGLSLEGLIFKTPEGTIKPWSKKCDFSDSALYTRLKRYCETGDRLFALGLSLGAMASMICSIIVLAKFKMSPMRWANVEEPPINSKDDEDEGKDTSKLLEPGTKLIEERE